MTDYDLLITTLFHQYSNSQVELILTIVTDFIYVILFYFLIHFFRKKQNKTLYLLIISGILGLGITTGLKYLINRPRPFPESGFDLLDHGSPSFPSRHSFLAGLGLFFIPKELSRRIKQLYQIYFLVVIPLGLLIMGVHYITDILVGLAIGYFIPLILNKFFKK